MSYFDCCECDFLGCSSPFLSCGELVGEVHFHVAPQKPGKDAEKQTFETEKIANDVLGVEKMKVWELSETRFW